jgi:hypothetical protein
MRDGLAAQSKFCGGIRRTGPSRSTSSRPTWFRSLLCASIPALVALVANESSAGEISWTFFLPKSAVTVEQDSDGARVGVRKEGYRSPLEPGVPDLPFRVVNFVLPRGHEVEGFTVTATKLDTLARTHRVRRVPPLEAGDGTKISAGSRAPSPRGVPSLSAPVVYLGTGYLHGYSIASFAVHPLHQAGGNIVLDRRFDLHISTREGPDARDVSARKRDRPAADHSARAGISRLVVNPRDAAGYDFARVAPGPPERAFAPTDAPSLEGSPVDYLIVTGSAMAGEYQRLADWKTAKGVPTVVRTTDWIQAHCRNGVDLAETIRFFLRDAYEKWGTRWVLLGGDTDVIPARYAYSTFLGEVSYVASDLYFACLDGSWNEDHDERWGEVDVDDTDLYAEVYVGRLPTSTAAEAAVLVDKITAYEGAAERDHTDKVLLLAEVLFPPDWSEGEDITLDGAALSESLYVSVFSQKRLRVTRAYETYMHHAGSVRLTKQAAIDSMNAGAGVVNHIGHGYRFNISCADASLVTQNADALTNQNRLFTLFMVDCFVSQFDYSCLAEHFMKNPNGGAVATIGASHKEFPVVDSYYMNDFYELLFEERVVRIGEAFAGSRLSQTPWAEMGNTVDLWTHYLYTLLADPEMPVWTDTVDTVSVSHAASVGLGAGTLTIQVSAGGVPADSAVVCLYKVGEDYRIGTTDAWGEAAIDFTAESPGSISVVVTGHNLARHQSYIAVDASSPAYVHFAGLTVDDDTLGGTFGNGDGAIDAGETVDLWLTLINTGGSTSAAVALEIACDEASVTVVDTTAPVGVIEPGSTAPAQEAVRVAFDVGVEDATSVEFGLAMTDGGGNWNDAFPCEVHAPALVKTTLRIDDDPPLGDGDGVIEAGEECLLFYGVKNEGAGATGAMTAQLSDVDDAFTFFDSTDVYENVSPLTAGENASGFHIVEGETTSEHLLAVSIVDLFGRVFRDTVELRPPDPPGGLGFDASRGVDRIEVSWSRSADPDVAKYNVYRSLVPGGPYQRVNVDAVDHAVFMDTGLMPSTRYYYVVSSIDRSGNESAYSSPSSACTNPPQAAGWPIEMATSTTSSPAVGDIDGDGDKEIVVGSEYVCALHHDGTEVRDGDQNPETWGILSTSGNVFTAAIALARLDAQPGLDIIATDMNTHSVYCMDHDGDALPGWPQAGENDFRAAGAAGDLDGDGVFEVVAVDTKGVIYAWRVDGSEVIDGDSNPMTTGVFFRTPATAYHYQTPALCDIDSDGRDEVLLGTRAGLLFALNGDGSAVSGWPVTMLGEAAGSVSIGDVDDDGALEVVCHTRSGRVYLINHDGTVAAGWPRFVALNEPYFCPSPALADFDGDGALEIVVAGYTASATQLCVIRQNGQFYTGWPVQFNTSVATECSPTVADIDGDGSLDILIGDESRYLYAFDIAGNMMDGFPIATSDAVRATPFLDDLDGDGDIDIVLLGWDKRLYVWDLAAAFDASHAPWPTFRANVHRNGEIDFEVPTAAGDGAAAQGPVPAPILLQNYPNPFAHSTTIAFHVSDGAPKPVSLRIYDVSGALVGTLVDALLAPGQYHVRWEGKDTRGERVATGLYFYRLEERDFTSTRKLLLIR